jgi:hypothetical protein
MRHVLYRRAAKKDYSSVVMKKERDRAQLAVDFPTEENDLTDEGEQCYCQATKLYTIVRRYPTTIPQGYTAYIIDLLMKRDSL